MLKTVYTGPLVLYRRLDQINDNSRGNAFDPIAKKKSQNVDSSI